MPYNFSRSSIKFQGHTGLKIADLNVPDSNSSLNSPRDEMMHTAWGNVEGVPYNFSRSSIKFQGHTGWKINNLNPIWVRLLGRSQLSNPSDFALLKFDRYIVSEVSVSIKISNGKYFDMVTYWLSYRRNWFPVGIENLKSPLLICVHPPT